MIKDKQYLRVNKIFKKQGQISGNFLKFQFFFGFLEWQNWILHENCSLLEKLSIVQSEFTAFNEVFRLYFLWIHYLRWERNWIYLLILSREKREVLIWMTFRIIEWESEKTRKGFDKTIVTLTSRRCKLYQHNICKCRLWRILNRSAQRYCAVPFSFSVTFFPTLSLTLFFHFLWHPLRWISVSFNRFSVILFLEWYHVLLMVTSWEKNNRRRE